MPIGSFFLLNKLHDGSRSKSSPKPKKKSKAQKSYAANPANLSARSVIDAYGGKTSAKKGGMKGGMKGGGRGGKSKATSKRQKAPTGVQGSGFNKLSKTLAKNAPKSKSKGKGTGRGKARKNKRMVNKINKANQAYKKNFRAKLKDASTPAKTGGISPQSGLGRGMAKTGGISPQSGLKKRTARSAGSKGSGSAGSKGSGGAGLISKPKTLEEARALFVSLSRDVLIGVQDTRLKQAQKWLHEFMKKK